MPSPPGSSGRRRRGAATTRRWSPPVERPDRIVGAADHRREPARHVRDQARVPDQPTAERRPGGRPTGGRGPRQTPHSVVGAMNQQLEATVTRRHGGRPGAGGHPATDPCPGRPGHVRTAPPLHHGPVGTTGEDVEVAAGRDDRRRAPGEGPSQRGPARPRGRRSRAPSQVQLFRRGRPQPRRSRHHPRSRRPVRSGSPGQALSRRRARRRRTRCGEDHAGVRPRDQVGRARG